MTLLARHRIVGAGSSAPAPREEHDWRRGQEPDTRRYHHDRAEPHEQAEPHRNSVRRRASGRVV
ncbi:hypothetical protein, partial [Streptomyces griseorubens]|uniref:hypothetical protein n=1 Tax=Streptomyces griseorubens TaxID=66897 RepID=UPI0035117279